MTSFTDSRAYLGKLNHPPYATDENFVMSFPKGMSEGAPVWVFSTWSQHSDGTKKKCFVNVTGKVTVDSAHRSAVKNVNEANNYYGFDGVFPMGGGKDELEVTVTLKGDRGFVVTFKLTKL